MSHIWHERLDRYGAVQMEVGIEDCLHIEFEYDKGRYHLKDTVVGKIYFLLVSPETAEPHCLQSVLPCHAFPSQPTACAHASASWQVHRTGSRASWSAQEGSELGIWCLVEEQQPKQNE